MLDDQFFIKLIFNETLNKEIIKKWYKCGTKNFAVKENSCKLCPEMLERRFFLLFRLADKKTENPCVAGSIPADTTKVKSLFSNENRLFYCFRADFFPMLSCPPNQGIWSSILRLFRQDY
jgi:hypothetical protein